MPCLEIDRVFYLSYYDKTMEKESVTKSDILHASTKLAECVDQLLSSDFSTLPRKMAEVSQQLNTYNDLVKDYVAIKDPLSEIHMLLVEELEKHGVDDEVADCIIPHFMKKLNEIL